MERVTRLANTQIKPSNMKCFINNKQEVLVDTQQNRWHLIGNRDCKSLARKCEKTVHPVTDRRYALYLKSPLKSILLTSTRHNSKTIELLPGNLPYIRFNMFSLKKCRSHK